MLGQPSRDVLDRIAVESPVEFSRDETDMRRGKDVIQRPERVIRRQRLDVEHVERRASNAAVTQNLDERRLVNYRSTRGIDEPGRWLHGLQLGRSDQALRPLAQNEVYRQDVSAAEEFLLGDEPRSACLCLVGREVLTPGDYFHAEREADSRNLRADVAEAENAERLAVETVAHRELPAAGAQMCVFQGDLTRARKDESPGHLDGGACIVSRMRYHDASLGRGLHIDGRVARTGRCDQLQSRQAPDD